MPGTEKRRKGGHTFSTSAPGSMPELSLYHLSWVSSTPVGHMLVLPFCRTASWGSESLSTILKCTELACGRNWTLGCLPRKSTCGALSSFLHLEGPVLKCPCILPILRGRHCLESCHWLLPRGVRESIMMDCPSKISILAISQKLDRDLLEQGSAFLCFKHSSPTGAPLVVSCSQALLKSLLQCHLSGSLLCSTLHHTLTLSPWPCNPALVSSWLFSPLAVLLYYKYYIFICLVLCLVFTFC